MPLHLYYGVLGWGGGGGNGSCRWRWRGHIDAGVQRCTEYKSGEVEDVGYFYTYVYDMWACGHVTYVYIVYMCSVILSPLQTAGVHSRAVGWPEQLNTLSRQAPHAREV